MNTFCMAPFSRMTGGPEGTYRTCCYHPPIEKRYTNVLDAFEGGEMQILRQRMLDGEHIKECESCYYYESIGELSQRQVINQEHTYIKEYHLEGLEISFNNKCNFACVTCKPESSSIWEDRVGKIDKITPDYSGVDFSKLKHLSFTGGEPTIQREFSPKFFAMLDEQVKYDTLFFSMNTNCSKFVHRPWVEFINKLKRVMIMTSIDGIGAVGEWVRLGLKMDIWEKNALRWKDLLKDNKEYTYGDMTSGVWSNFVMTNYNVFNVDETEKYLASLGIRMRKTNCFSPEYLSPEYLPDEIKKELPANDFVQNILNANEYNEKHCKEFMVYTKYLETFAPAPEEAKFVYRKLEEYYVAN
jgi:MoaA/NifB/PqqE/SkfB family radical SAM enzyme